MPNVKISQLTSFTSLDTTDVLPCVKNVAGTDTTGKITVDNLATSIGIGDTLLSHTTNYTKRPPTVGTISFASLSMGSRGDLAAGHVVRLTQGSTQKFYLVTAISGSAPSFTVSVSGPPLDTSVDITDDSFYVLNNQRAVPVDVVFSGAYAIGGTTTNTLIQDETKSQLRWHGPPSKLLYFAARNNTADSSSATSINVALNGTVSASSSNVSVSGSGSWNSVANGTITDTNIAFGEYIEVKLTGVGGDGDARDLTVSLVFAMEQ